MKGSRKDMCQMGKARCAASSGTKVLCTERSHAAGSRYVRMNLASGYAATSSSTNQAETSRMALSSVSHYFACLKLGGGEEGRAAAGGRGW